MGKVYLELDNILPEEVMLGQAERRDFVEPESISPEVEKCPHPEDLKIQKSGFGECVHNSKGADLCRRACLVLSEKQINKEKKELSYSSTSVDGVACVWDAVEGILKEEGGGKERKISISVMSID